MLKPFEVKKTDWEEFNKVLFDKICELQKAENTIKNIKYSTLLLRGGVSSPIGGVRTDPTIEYSAIILYDNNEG